MLEYLDFVDYGGGVIFVHRIPAEEWSKLYIIDTGMVSAQANFVLWAAGWDNVRVLNGGFAEWKRDQVEKAAHR